MILGTPRSILRSSMTTPDRILRITKFAVVESLREADVEFVGHTGEKLAREVAAALIDAGVNLDVKVYRCDSTRGFSNVISLLTEEAERGEHHPLLHIECHGHEDTGLEFGDGSILTWSELADVLRPLNVATRIGLVASVAACYGGHALAGIDPMKPAPCFAFIGPTSRLWSSELYDCLRDFYIELLKLKSAEEATRGLMGKKLENGAFMVLTARQWFKALIDHYLTSMASHAARETQALRLFEQAREEGWGNLDMEYWRRHFLETMPKLLTQYHRRFFMVEEFPEEAQHFAQSLEDIMQSLRDRGFQA